MHKLNFLKNYLNSMAVGTIHLSEKNCEDVYKVGTTKIQITQDK